MIVGVFSLLYAWRRINNAYGPQGKIFVRKHFVYVIAFIVIWTMYSIYNGIFLYCYIIADNDMVTLGAFGNSTIYDKCFGNHKETLVILTNVNFHINL